MKLLSALQPRKAQRGRPKRQGGHHRHNSWINRRKVFFLFRKKPPETFKELLEKVQKYMNVKDMVTAHRQQIVNQGEVATKRRK